MLVFLKKNRIKKILRKQNEKYRSSYSHLCYSKLDSKLDYVAVLSMNLRKKCDKNDGFNKLNFEEKVVCLNYSFANEICTYGLIDYLYGKQANYYQELVLSLHEVGAYELENLLKATVELLRGELPTVQSKRRNVLNKVISDYNINLLNEIEKTMFLYLEDLLYLIYDYVNINRNKFNYC